MQSIFLKTENYAMKYPKGNFLPKPKGIRNQLILKREYYIHVFFLFLENILNEHALQK